MERTSTLQQTKPLGLFDLSNLQLRFLCPQDINEVMSLIQWSTDVSMYVCSESPVVHLTKPKLHYNKKNNLELKKHIIFNLYLQSTFT